MTIHCILLNDSRDVLHSLSGNLSERDTQKQANHSFIWSFIHSFNQSINYWNLCDEKICSDSMLSTINNGQCNDRTDRSHKQITTFLWPTIIIWAIFSPKLCICFINSFFSRSVNSLYRFCHVLNQDMSWTIFSVNHSKYNQTAHSNHFIKLICRWW